MSIRSSKRSRTDRRSRLLFALASLLGSATLLDAQVASGQDFESPIATNAIVWENPFVTYNDRAWVVSEPVITIISERVIEPAVKLVADQPAAVDRLVEMEAKLEKPELADKERVSVEVTVLDNDEDDDDDGDEKEPKKCDASCGCLKQGGDLWNKILEQELENARLVARLELQEERMELRNGEMRMHAEQQAEALKRERMELDHRAREIEEMTGRMKGREAELEVLLDRERAQFAEKSQAMEMRMREMADALERKSGERGNADELKGMLEGAKKRISAIEAERNEMAEVLKQTQGKLKSVVESVESKQSNQKSEFVEKARGFEMKMAAMEARMNQTAIQLAASEEAFQKARRGEEMAKAEAAKLKKELESLRKEKPKRPSRSPGDKKPE